MRGRVARLLRRCQRRMVAVEATYDHLGHPILVWKRTPCEWVAIKWGYTDMLEAIIDEFEHNHSPWRRVGRMLGW